jgi:hypothetical protein
VTNNIGDVIKLSAVGSTIKVFHNDVEKISVTDSTFTSGYCGVRFNGANERIDDFKVEAAS